MAIWKVIGRREFYPKALFLKKKFFLHLFIFETQREMEHKSRRSRERETQNPKQAPGSELSAQSLTMGLKLMNYEIMT